MISPEEAALLIHKLITESTSVVAFFVSPDGVRSKITGKLSVLPGLGLAIRSEPGATSWLHVESAAFSASKFEYAEAHEREGMQFESGLTILLSSDARLTLLEPKSISPTS